MKSLIKKEIGLHLIFRNSGISKKKVTAALSTSIKDSSGVRKSVAPVWGPQGSWLNLTQWVHVSLLYRQCLSLLLTSDSGGFL